MRSKAPTTNRVIYSPDSEALDTLCEKLLCIKNETSDIHFQFYYGDFLTQLTSNLQKNL